MSMKAGDGAFQGDPIRVFLSYRRSDDRNFVGRFHDRLVARYGEENVFMDIDSIHAGSNFSAVIAEQVAMVDAVIVMIGPTWAARLHQTGDLVRMEVAESIAGDCVVVPVLIEDTPIPAADSLPADLEELLALNITRVRSGVDFHRDTTRTLEGLEAGVAIARRAKVIRSAAPVSSSRRLLTWGAGLLIGVALLAGLVEMFIKIALWPSARLLTLGVVLLVAALVLAYLLWRSGRRRSYPRTAADQ